MTSFAILLQAGTGSGNYSFMIMLGLMFVIMYFFMIRPQQKKAKDQKKFIEEVKKGDYIVTIGGMHGRVAELEASGVYPELGRRLEYRRLDPAGPVAAAQRCVSTPP